MSTNFILADLISRLNVGMRSHVVSVNVPYFNLSLKLVDLLYNNGLIESYIYLGKNIQVNLKYVGGRGIFSSIKIVSKPSKRVY